MVNVVIYARYSCDNQKEESIEGQIRECREYCERNQLIVINEYIDRAFSARSDNRPEFQAMIKDSSRRKFEKVIVWKLDRFSRNRYDSAKYKAALRLNGVKVVSATENISESPEGIILESVLEGLAEYYSKDLAQKVTRGMTENHLKGLYNGATIPYGYDVVNKRFVINSKEAQVVKRIFNLYTTTEITLNGIATLLNKEGITNKKNMIWKQGSIGHIISNKKYIGELWFGSKVNKTAIEPIIDNDIFLKAQEKKEINKGSSARFLAIEKYFLVNKLFCADCGCKMTSEMTRKKDRIYRWYKCSDKKRNKNSVCSNIPIKKELIENLIIKTIKLIIFEIIPRDKLVQKIFEYQKKFNPMISIYKKEISTIENKINNITRAVEDGAPYKLFSFKIIELENRKSELEVELNKAIIDNETLEIELINSNFKKYLDIDFNNKMEKSFIINSLVDSIALSHNGEITISIKYSQRKIKSINQDSEIIKNIENKSNKLLSNWKLVPGLIIFVTSINEYKSKIENRRIRRNKY